MSNNGYNTQRRPRSPQLVSFCARKELTQALTISLVIGKEPAMVVHVPKLALIVASPVVRAHFAKNPTEPQAKFTHPDVSLESVRQIAKWLREVCNKPAFSELPIPQDPEEALKLRLTAHTLGMERYVEHFETYFLEHVNVRFPSLQYITEIVENTREKDDPILVSLASLLSYLCRYHKVSQEKEIEFAELLAENKYSHLLDAVDEEKVKALAGGGWSEEWKV
ncbi:hypothetical protein EK21DRAFT_87236 [Setomelanomma holmii]|uniref:Uncharacterized protein n=1 Tax=Setomelanomma holmii TaxID=210430 RepID=A0A9P4LNU5_9PLEO|nr:hypothetical protein EK21DRAFT_87236 [Setomelanomma holmii]